MHNLSSKVCVVKLWCTTQALRKISRLNLFPTRKRCNKHSRETGQEKLKLSGLGRQLAWNQDGHIKSPRGCSLSNAVWKPRLNHKLSTTHLRGLVENRDGIMQIGYGSYVFGWTGSPGGVGWGQNFAKPKKIKRGG